MELIVKVKVTPQSGKSYWNITKNGTMHCFLKNAPEKNKANEELIALTAAALKIPKSHIEIMQGQLNRYKILKIITQLSYSEFLSKVGITEMPTTFL